MSRDSEGAQPPTKTFALSDSERRTLTTQLEAHSSSAEPLGFALRGADTFSDRGLVAQIPGTPAGELSVCGLKDFLIDELRRFQKEDGTPAEVRCAAAAVLEMTDSPVHVHAATLEYYVVLAGSGKMVLGSGADERIAEVAEGSVIILPPGQPHGICSSDPAVPLRALLTFTPGLAPKSQPEFRDEKILFARTSERVEQLTRGGSS